MPERIRKILDSNLIEKFRETVNGNNHYVRYKYYNIKGENDWNIVCSCIDWIKVSVNYLYSFPDFSKNIDNKVMQMNTLLISIDNILEAIKQLHRVFYDDQRLKIYPFNGRNNIFIDKKIICKDDESYFKEIRACFGAHPTKLRNNNKKYFASWPFLPLPIYYSSKDDLSVRLYPLNADEDDIKIGLNVKELMNFAKERYEYLLDISCKINELYLNYCIQKSKKTIPNADSDTLSELKILKDEAKERLNISHYTNTIDELIMIFSTSIEENHLMEKEKEYKKQLNKLINEIRKNLQSMSLGELVYAKLLDYELNNKMNSYSYHIEKFSEWLICNNNNDILNNCLEKMNEMSGNEYIFSIQDSKDITFLKFKMMLFYMSNK
ncbi:TPA: hypothetical protein ACPUIE_000277 [Proteus mirabilis]|nr:hypothetical protein [Proteus mirabilis]ELI0196659.1 hypothetical protein [Proteus mirabilis]ELT7777013.1 hypothetical protein [Proteus mirabilis]MBG2829920.1 hypothetical protein [Proteus mirabilis]MBG3045598.1 hypothetical protein [Proteus mirabilis]MBG3052350.1 hypothetical protein [Proteus mirabilis]